MKLPKPYGACSWRRRSLYYWAGCFLPDTLFSKRKHENEFFYTKTNVEQSTKTNLA